MRLIRQRQAWWLLTLMLSLVSGASLLAQDAVTIDDLPGPASYTLFKTNSYTICTNLTRDEILPIGTHMDAIFAEYSSRFKNFNRQVTEPMRLYVFRTRKQYEEFLKSNNMESRNTGGMFFWGPKIHGLATYTDGRPMSEVYAVLQHEGFHQFAFSYIGPNLPLWVNEGLAQYFEDGILVGDQFYLGLANGRRIMAVSSAITGKRMIPFLQLLSLSEKEWLHNVAMGGPTAGLQYDQSWSIVYFLIHAENGKYLKAFEKYLTLVSQKRSSVEAFSEAFGSNDLDPFEKAWQTYALNVRPEGLYTVMERMEFLASGMQYLKDHQGKIPKSTEELRALLQGMELQVKKKDSYGNQIIFKALDESLYRYTSASTHVAGYFKLLPADQPNLLPKITAPGIVPQPMVVWYFDGKDEDGKTKLMYDVVFVAPPK